MDYITVTEAVNESVEFVMLLDSGAGAQIVLRPLNVSEITAICPSQPVNDRKMSAMISRL